MKAPFWSDRSRILERAKAAFGERALDVDEYTDSRRVLA
jgi:hypothetical protein